MKPDDSLTVYVLYGCTLSKERSSMRIVAATTDEEMLHTIIGAQILGGTMDYRGFSNMKGFEQFRAACRAGDVQYSNLDYGFVEQTENLMEIAMMLEQLKGESEYLFEVLTDIDSITWKQKFVDWANEFTETYEPNKDVWPGNYLEVIEGFAREKILEFAGVEEKE